MNRPAAVVTEHLHHAVQSGDQSLVILNDISVTWAAGKSHALVGRSGVGKTTLLSLLAGLDTPTSGRIVLNGQEISQADEETRAQVRAGRIGFVFQSFQLLPAWTARDNVALAAEIAGLDRPLQRADAALASVGLGDRLHHRPAQLSGGEQQRVALARAFVMTPEILFADEPTGNLDARTGAQIMDLLFQLQAERGTTLILVTHDSVLATRCDQVWTLDETGCHAS